MSYENSKKICIIAGSGKLPKILADAARNKGFNPHIITIEDQHNIALNSFDHIEIKLGQLGKAIKYLQKNNISQICFAGKISRPATSKLQLDIEGIKFLASLGIKKLSGGDDELLNHVVKFFERHKIQVIAPNELCPEIAAEKGVLGKIKPLKGDVEDIKYGEDILKTLSPYDIGQAVIIENKYVLGVEASEGTDQLIKRIKSYKKEKDFGVLVKRAKINQHPKMDLPTIGMQTLKNVIASNLSGIAIEAGKTLIVDRKKLVAMADKHKIFIIGI